MITGAIGSGTGGGAVVGVPLIAAYIGLVALGAANFMVDIAVAGAGHPPGGHEPSMTTGSGNSGGPPAGAPQRAPTASNRPLPAPENYRGRYNAARAAEGKSRLPEDWDAHYRIPQEYREHPDFKDFDFDAPSNIHG